MKYICLISLICLIWPIRAYAQSVSLAVNPPVVEILLSPGKQVTQTFTFQSTGEDISVVPELHLVKPADENGHVQIDPTPLIPSSIPLVATITGPSTSPTLTLEAANVDIATDVYLALVFRASPPTTNSQIPTTPSISSLILVTINPTGVMPINLDIKDFTLPIVHDSWDPLTLSPSVQNLASIMIRPEGKFEVTSPTGKSLLSLPLYPNLVLGNSSRALLVNLDPPTTNSQIPNTTPPTWSPSWSNLGPHRLTLTITTQGGTKLTQIEKTVWVLPIRVIIFATLISIICLTLRSKRSRFKTV